MKAGIIEGVAYGAVTTVAWYLMHPDVSASAVLVISTFAFWFGWLRKTQEVPR